MSNIVDVARKVSSFKTWVDAVDAAGMSDVLANKGPFTVLIPTEQAFGKLAPGAVDNLLHDKAKIRQLLVNHVVEGRASSDDVMARKTIATLGGDALPVSIQFDGLHVGNARVVEADLLADNGVIHAVDTLLFPKAA